MKARILLGVAGGIAAYKAAELVRALQRADHEVRVMMTRSATEFIAPLTFATLTAHKVYTGLWQNGADATDIEHITQAQWADLVLLAPTTANLLAKLAHGLADDFITTACLATTAPLLLAPAMNTNMWLHPATQANLQLLQARGVRYVPPGSGDLACGIAGAGRLAEIESIVQAVQDTCAPMQDMSGEVVLVTAGGTREPVDAVRFLGNRSSGRMGYAIAAAAAHRGAHVLLVSAPTPLAAPRGCELTTVTTSAEMREAVLSLLPTATIVVKAAAVSDFRVRNLSSGKLERGVERILQLEPTEDIVREVVLRRSPNTFVLAFAAEFGLDVERARGKLQRKGADAIFLNDISQSGLGFDTERNAGMLLTADRIVTFPAAPKATIAEALLDQIITLRSATRHTALV